MLKSGTRGALSKKSSRCTRRADTMGPRVALYQCALQPVGSPTCRHRLRPAVETTKQISVEAATWQTSIISTAWCWPGTRLRFNKAKWLAAVSICLASSTSTISFASLQTKWLSTPLDQQLCYLADANCQMTIVFWQLHSLSLSPSLWRRGFT